MKSQRNSHAPRRAEAATEHLFAERYRLSSRVGKGGMAEVWAAYDTRSGREVALKIVSMNACEPGMSRARFRREAELAKQLRGPAFVEVFDHGVCQEGAFVAMDLLRGESLHERLDRGVSFSLEEARELLVGVGGALRVAHALQVVHRDIKPGNVFFARLDTKRSGVQPLDGRREIVKLLDFGIAKDTWDEVRLTQPGMVLGSAFYMSPEQIRSSRDVDTRADLWSLAIILYMALTSHRPFGSEPSTALARILVDPAPPPSTFRRDLPRSIDTFFVRALAKDIHGRFQTIDEMIEGFDAALGSSGIEVDVELDTEPSPPVAFDTPVTPVRSSVGPALREAPTRIYPQAKGVSATADDEEGSGIVARPALAQAMRESATSAAAPRALPTKAAPARAVAPLPRRAVVSPSMPPYLSTSKRAWIGNVFAVLLVAGLAFAAWWFRADIARLLPWIDHSGSTR